MLSFPIMAKTFLLSILVAALFLIPFCRTQRIESTPFTITESSVSYPSGCRLYQSRRLLQCRYAGLRAIPELSESWNVTKVDLSGNNISAIHFAGDGYKNVKSINLERNNITSISEELILQLRHIHLLSIRGNPFHCDCKLKWLRDWLLGSNNHFPYVRHIQDLKCATPASLQGRTVATLSEEALCGPKPEDKLLRPTTQEPETDETLTEKKQANLTAQALLVEAREKAMEKGRIVEIIGVTFGFAAIIVLMSVAFIVM